MRHLAFIVIIVCSLTPAGFAQTSFVNWESPQVHPLESTPDGSRLLALNTADNRLEVYGVKAGVLTHLGAVPVGLDPVAVRALNNTEVWVVNHISDSISIVDLTTMNVIETLTTGDEPADVVFAGAPARAFVSSSQLNQVWVYDPLDLAANPVILNLEGEDPRALASDGTTVYAAIFESGNNTTILPTLAVSNGGGPYAGTNPPPNDGASFKPPVNGDLPLPPTVGLIVNKVASVWLDDNGADWSNFVTWDLHDHDLAMIDAATLSVSYVSGLMNANMALAVDAAGAVTVVGTEAINHIRFEPNLNGIFVQVVAARLTAERGIVDLLDLNPHLDYTTPTVEQAVRDQSIGDPRGITWAADGRGYISGMGSNNLVVVDAALQRVGLIEVGQGPTGVVADPSAPVVYVLNRFEGSISVIDTDLLIENARVGFFDPTPASIRAGRPHLYDTHATSGLGQASCASCHIDGRMDQLAWDLGDPSGELQTFNQDCDFGTPGQICDDWHPMKGPMTTQTLLGIIGTEPFHWRGDREDLAGFNGAFVGLMGDDAQLSPAEMDEFEAFVATLTPPPNPYRNLDGSLPTMFSNGGDPANGEALFGGSEGNTECTGCHTLPTGSTGTILSSEGMKIPQLRNMYEKTGFDDDSMSNNRGFGYTHDGAIDSVHSFLQIFSLTEQQRLDLVAFTMCLSTDTHAGVGTQTTVRDAGSAPSGQLNLLAEMRSLADADAVGLVVKGVQNGQPRGYVYVGGDQYQSDRAAESLSHDTLFNAAVPAEELTFTLVPFGSQTRIGIDRDEDGFWDGDEIDAGSDPADPESLPAEPCPSADIDDSGAVNAADLALLLGNWGPNAHAADLNDDGGVDAADLALLLGNWGPCGR